MDHYYHKVDKPRGFPNFKVHIKKTLLVHVILERPPSTNCLLVGMVYNICLIKSLSAGVPLDELASILFQGQDIELVLSIFYHFYLPHFGLINGSIKAS